METVQAVIRPETPERKYYRRHALGFRARTGKLETADVACTFEEALDAAIRQREMILNFEKKTGRVAI